MSIEGTPAVAPSRERRQMLGKPGRYHGDGDPSTFETPSRAFILPTSSRPLPHPLLKHTIMPVRNIRKNCPSPRKPLGLHRPLSSSLLGRVLFWLLICEPRAPVFDRFLYFGT
jgi:hypothetical protein